jgi:uncharacterized membrane protein YhhN
MDSKYPFRIDFSHFEFTPNLPMLFHWAYFVSMLVPTSILSIYTKLCKRDLYPWFKPLPIFFLLSAPLMIRLDQFTESPFFVLVTLGLTFGLIGDIILLYPHLFMLVSSNFFMHTHLDLKLMIFLLFIQGFSCISHWTRFLHFWVHFSCFMDDISLDCIGFFICCELLLCEFVASFL